MKSNEWITNIRSREVVLSDRENGKHICTLSASDSKKKQYRMKFAMVHKIQDHPRQSYQFDLTRAELKSFCKHVVQAMESIEKKL